MTVLVKEVVATTGEIFAESRTSQRIDPEAHDADTKVRTAIAWLEEAQILERHENHTRVLPASLLVATVEEARTRLLHKLKDAALLPDYLSIVTALMNCADDDESVHRRAHGPDRQRLPHRAGHAARARVNGSCCLTIPSWAYSLSISRPPPNACKRWNDWKRPC